MGHAESNAIEQWATSVSMKSAEILDGTGKEGRKGEKEGKERERGNVCKRKCYNSLRHVDRT